MKLEMKEIRSKLFESHRCIVGLMSMDIYRKHTGNTINAA